MIALVLSLAAAAPDAGPPPPSPAEVAGQTFVADVAAGRVEQAAAAFDEAMAAALSPPRLAFTWNKLQAEGGAYQKIVDVRREKLPNDLVAVFVRIKLEKADVDAKIVYTKDQKIAGLWFVPPAPPAWVPPPYADPEKVREIELVVGKTWPLPATLTLPLDVVDKVPAVVLVHGSGPNDRDETIGAVKPFRDLAIGLANRGIAVLRYEKRTAVHGARLATEVPRFTLDDETVDDAALAVEQLALRKEVDPARIYVVGHSLGGTAAPRIAARAKRLAGLVVLAGSTRPLGDLVVDQLVYVSQLDGAMDPYESTLLANARAFRAASKAPDLRPGAKLDLLGAELTGAYLLDLRDYDAPAAAAALSIPMLFLQGGRDYQVTRADLDGWKAALGKKKNATFKVFDQMNHLFVVGTGPSSPAEYLVPAHVDPAVIDTIAKFCGAKKAPAKTK